LIPLFTGQACEESAWTGRAAQGYCSNGGHAAEKTVSKTPNERSA
jgi:hypothetical protein